MGTTPCAGSTISSANVPDPAKPNAGVSPTMKPARPKADITRVGQSWG
jgi:hypothetical protein